MRFLGWAIICVLVGLFGGLLLSGWLGRIISCGFDWGVFWTAAQAIAVAAAALAAIVQIRAYLKTELDKNTISLFRELDGEEINSLINMIYRRKSPERNVSRVHVLFTDPKFKKTRDGVAQKLQTLANFFERVALQYDAETINRRLYVRRMDEMTLMVFVVLQEAGKYSAYELPVEELRKLARACQINYASRICEKQPGLISMQIET